MARVLETVDQMRARGLTRAAIRWGERVGLWRRLDRNVYGMGPEPPRPVDQARAAVLAVDGVASGRLAAVLLGLDGVTFAGPDISVEPTRSGRRRGVRRRSVPDEHVVIVDGIRTTDALWTLVDLAALVDDLVWEQALECALRRGATSIEALQALIPQLARARTPGIARMRAVLALRPPGAAPTGSLLETLMLQLARSVPGLGEPVRQCPIYDDRGRVFAYADLAWPDIGLFIELDGEHHEGQPRYDSSRETAIVAATGWLPGRFTWTEVVHNPAHTQRRLSWLAARAQRRSA